MTNYDVVGKSTFISKKTNKDCFLLHCTCEFGDNEKGKGRKCNNFFVPYKVYEGCDVGDVVNLYFNQGGYVEDVNIVE